MDLPQWLADLTPWGRIAVFVGVAVAAHGVAVLVRALSLRLLKRADPQQGQSSRLATVATLSVSIVTFVVYFGTAGFILQEIGVPLKTYLASASVIALAVGFGLQGLVQDLIVGLTLIFSDVLNVGDMVDLSGQSGRVDRIGLRFTTLINSLGQEVFVPNRNISQIARYRRGVIRAYVDLQLPAGVSPDEVVRKVHDIAKAVQQQHSLVLVTEPEVLGVYTAEPSDWQYVRLKFRVWPGQGSLVETTFKQRALAVMRSFEEDYPDWKVTVTYGLD